MIFSLTDVTVALSRALDLMEIDFLGGVTYHSRRVAYIALRLAELCGYSTDELSDLISLAILHDNGFGKEFQSRAARDPAASPVGELSAVESSVLHCLAGEENLEGYPFLSKPVGVLRCHHENWDGSGFLRISGEAIPLSSRIIRLADLIERRFPLGSVEYEGKLDLYEWIREQSGRMLDPRLVDAFREASAAPAFWLDLESDFVGRALMGRMPQVRREMSFTEMREATRVFSRIIDSKSRFTRVHSQELSEKAGIMAARYGYDAERTAQLRIAADLHDIGKLAVPNRILEKPGKLDPPEIDVIQRHTYYTRVSLSAIRGFEDITEWAANHHERVDGTGYPFRLSPERLDFNSRLLACLDIYQALTELRPYREGLEHGQALSILRGMAAQGRIDAAITEDVDEVFRES